MRPACDALYMYRLCQCGIGSSLPGFREASEASLALVWLYTRCYMHYTVLMVPMIARVPYDSAMLLSIHALMWAMFALQLYWGGDALQEAPRLLFDDCHCRHHGAKSSSQVRVRQEGCHEAPDEGQVSHSLRCKKVAHIQRYEPSPQLSCFCFAYVESAMIANVKAFVN
jgi:hypothetical protein